jgi:hypothetical protein
VADVADGSTPVVETPAVPAAIYVPQDVLYDNGPLVTHPGGGSGGADASALQTALGLTIYGFGHQAPLNYRMADDFVISDPAGWQVDTITFFAYQTARRPTLAVHGSLLPDLGRLAGQPGSSVVLAT